MAAAPCTGHIIRKGHIVERKCNWRILFLDTKIGNPNHYLAVAIVQALRLHHDVEMVINANYGNAVSSAQRNQCNLFFAFDGEGLDRYVCSKLAEICGSSIVWNVEDPYEIRGNVANMDLFDLVFTNDAGSVQDYRERGRHLPLAASVNQHFREIPPKYRYDLFFAGVPWPNRVELLQRIISDIRDLKVKLALPTNEHLPLLNIDLPPSTYEWRTSNGEFCNFSNQSRINLLLHRKFTVSGGRPEALTPGPRLFEVALAGGFQLADEGIPGLNSIYDEGVDYAAFSDAQDCVDKIRYYLKHEDRRMEMLRSARKKTKQAHLYSNRVDDILSEVSSLHKAASVCVNSSRPKRMLMVCHNIAGRIPYGGVETYMDMCLPFIRDEFDCFFYVSASNTTYNTDYLLLDANYKELKRVSTLTTGGWPCQYLLSCPQKEQAFAAVLSEYHIDLVHFNHLLGHVPSLIYIAKACGIPTLLSVHDYYPLTHHFNLVGPDGVYSDQLLSGNHNLDIHLRETEEIQAGSQAIRKAFWSAALSHVDVIHVNSAYTRDVLLEYYPHLEGHVVQRGIPVRPMAVAGREDGASSEMLRILVLGNVTRIKGGEVMFKIFKYASPDKFEFHVYGQVSKDYMDAVKTMPHVQCHGAFSNADLRNITRDMDVSLHLSVWPETYCMTLSEVWQAGVIPVVTALGALKERVIHQSNGFLVEPNDVGGVLDVLDEIYSSPELLKRMRENITPSMYEGLDDHVDWLLTLYKNMTKQVWGSTSNETAAFSLAKCGRVIQHPVWAKFAPDSHYLMLLKFYKATTLKKRVIYYLLAANRLRRRAGNWKFFMMSVREILVRLGVVK